MGENMNIDNEYLKALDDLEKILDEKSAKNVDEILDKIYNIKPVRLKWFLLKAKTAGLLNNDTSEIRNQLLLKYDILYNNDSLKDVAMALIDLSDDADDNERLLYHIAKKEDASEHNKLLSEKQNEYNTLAEKYISGNITQQEFEKLILNCYIRNDYIQYILFIAVYEKIYNASINIYKQVIEMPNMEMFMERLKFSEAKNYIVMNSENKSYNCEAVIKALKEFNSNVICLDTPLTADVDNRVKPEKTLPVSIENAVNKNGVITIQPVKLRLNGEIYAENTEHIINFINQNFAKDHLTFILSAGADADKICSTGTLKKSTERLSLYKADYFEDNLALCRSGDYLSFISEIYEFDVHEAIDAEAECDFSIVIPVSNSVDTFKHTLRSCLELRYDGSYEIVVSDNSRKDNNAVYEYVNSIQDERVKYFRTPKALPLTKSFEFAFLNTRGRFILSIGADDAVLPWALDVLDSVLPQIPDNEVVLWDRGFYAWPGFNGGQQHQFIIPRGYNNSGNIDVESINANSLLVDVINNPSFMYAMPLLYINSGFRRSYFKTLLDKTGRLWDGHSQDIYMGIVNACINSEILRIIYPLTIAGMSGHSIGKSSNYELGVITNKHPSYMHYVTVSENERAMPLIGSDVQSVYCAVLRLAARGLLPDEFIENLLNRTEIYESQIALIRKESFMYDEYIRWYLQCMKNSNKKMADDFIEKEYDKLYLPVEINEESEDGCDELTRAYKIGFNEAGGLNLDASEFGVQNVYEATKLFEKLTGM